MSEATTTETVTTETTHEVTPNVSEVDEDYKWLTDRLDAQLKEMQETRSLFLAQLEAMREANQNSLSESRTLIQSLTEMVTTQSQTLSAIAAASVLSQSTPSNLPNSSTETETETETIVSPESVVEENREVRTEPVARKRRLL